MALVIAADRGSRWKFLGEPSRRQIALQEARRGERSGGEQDHVGPMGQAILACHAGNSFWRPLVAEQSEDRLVGDDGYIRFDGFASVMGLKSDAETCLLDRIRDKPELRQSIADHLCLGAPRRPQAH